MPLLSAFMPSMIEPDHPSDLTAKGLPKTLVAALFDAKCFPHPVSRIELLETHISWVVLTGQYAYKIKKPVELGFLDFSTLEKRRLCCLEELRLNRRYAPQLYLDIVKITGTIENPAVDGDGSAIEFAVKMRQFCQEELASRLIVAGKLTPRQLEQFALALCAFHSGAASASPDGGFGTPQTVLEFALQNFTRLFSLPELRADAPALKSLYEWTMQEYHRLQSNFEQRAQTGAVRECHGDLHLGNIVSINGMLLAFDCIEFSPALRWIDVMSEVAFLVMDLHDRKHPELAWLFLNAYLEHSGDYAGLALLKFYLVYRAMVRAKVHGIRALQPEVSKAECLRLLEACRGYLDLGAAFAHPARPVLVITHGLSGSGKSRITEELMQQLGAVRIRSDVERKRRYGLAPEIRGSSSIATGMYGDPTTRELYIRLAELARNTLDAGHTTIIDATFLKSWQRDLLRDLARDIAVPFLIANVIAPESALRERVEQRAINGHDASDAGIAVLEHQLATQEQLSAGELSASVTISSDSADPQACCAPLLHALRRIAV